MPEEIVPTEESQKKETPKPMEEKKEKRWLRSLLFSVLGIIVAVGLVFAGYKLAQLKQVQPGPQPTPTPEAVATPTPDLTADWKTYTNTKLGFSVKYPEDWPEPKERFLATRTVVEFGTVASIDVGVVYNQEKQRELTYLEIADQYSNGKKKPRFIIVDGRPAAYLEMREEDLVAPKPNPFNFVSIEKGREVYMFYFSFGGDLSERENEQKIFNLMLSTFKFLE